MPARPFSPAHALRHLLPRYVAEWVRLAARRPLPAQSGAPADREAASADGRETTDRPLPADEAAQPARHRLLFVDAFARSGLHALERGAGGVVRAVDGERSVAAVRELLAAAAREPDARQPVDAIAVLVDEDPAHLTALAAELERVGLADRVRRVADPSAAAPGDIVLVEADYADVADALHDLAASSTDSLFFLAPPAARRLPWPSFAALAAMDSVDVLLALPHADLHRLAPFADTSLADLPPQPRRIVEGFSALLGDARHGWLTEWRRAERDSGAAAAEARLAVVVAERLRLAAGDGIVRPFRFSAEAQPASRPTLRGATDPPSVLHLFHASPDPSHALGFNAVLREMRVEDTGESGSSRRAPRLAPTEAQKTVLELFPADGVGGGSRPGDADLPADVAALADGIASEFRGRTVAYRAVLAWLTSMDVTADEARRSMALLKRSGRAVYRSLADDTAEVAFPTSPVLPTTRRPRMPPADEAGSLFAPPGDDAST
jgi:three-Cys-motif partner protein